MKKKFAIFILMTALTCSSVLAHPPGHDKHGDNPPPPPPPPPPVPVATYVENYTQSFPGCDEHTLLINEIITEYSDRTTNVDKSYSVIDMNGYTILSNANFVEHLFRGYEHYFLVKKNGYFHIMDSYGQILTSQDYISARIIADDRISVTRNLSFFKIGYGIIDFTGREVVPTKYQTLKQSYINGSLFLSKLNGYWGLLDFNNSIYLRNEYDNIKEIYQCYLTKKEGKYGLVNIKGQVILDTKYDKIEKKGDYIIVKKDKLWAVYNQYGKMLTPYKYTKIKLERNVLIGKTYTSEEIIAK